MLHKVGLFSLGGIWLSGLGEDECMPRNPEYDVVGNTHCGHRLCEGVANDSLH